MRIDHAKTVQIVELLAEGLGVCSTARVTDCRPETVLNVLQTIGAKCEASHDRLVRHIQTGSIQIDELWAKVYCSQKNALSLTKTREISPCFWGWQPAKS
ncbi:MAG TPA: hypothetical protein VFC44_22800 [Candidatus Saccharimonadales bacterium]|nr:hypothetical protein [Candidatus Saccharimonadales bacterium]